ncbi:MAG: ABC transporter substrate-binding protein [Candidatus Tectomicrobia bacterium]|nr:ABC transporter substrate-binding protein [Candidatus Tectomicrobia bacterium]
MKQLLTLFLLFGFLFLFYQSGDTHSGPSPSMFIFGAQGEPACLDPPVIKDGISARITNQIFEGLVKYEGSTINIIPSLAEKWDVSRDGKTWTFFLRKRVTFHDGTPFNADAVVWNFNRWRQTDHPQHKNRVAAGQTFEYYEVQFRGFDNKSIITNVKAVDPTTVRITLKEPHGPFLNNLAMSAFVFSSPKAVEQYGTESCKHPVGTGPFKFAGWEADEYVVLETNATYWDKAAMPHVKRVVIRNIKDVSQRLAALKAGEIHGMEGVNARDVKVVRADTDLIGERCLEGTPIAPKDLKLMNADPTLQVFLRPANTTGYVAFNSKVKEFQDKRVRQAMAHAINKEAIVEALYGETGLVATQFQPPSLWGYNSELKDYEYDPGKAKQLLAEAGFPNGLKEITWEGGGKAPLEFYFMPIPRPYFPNPQEIAEAIASDLAKVGIMVSLQTTEPRTIDGWATYLEKRKKGQLPLYLFGWKGDNGDPDNFICYSSLCSNSKMFAEGSYSNQALTDLLLKAQKLTSQKERAELYKRAEEMIHEDVALIFIANNQPPLAFSKKVIIYIPNPIGMEYFNTIELLHDADLQ